MVSNYEDELDSLIPEMARLCVDSALADDKTFQKQRDEIATFLGQINDFLPDENKKEIFRKFLFLTGVQQIKVISLYYRQGMQDLYQHILVDMNDICNSYDLKRAQKLKKKQLTISIRNQQSKQC